MIDAIRLIATATICWAHLANNAHWAAVAGVLALYTLSGHLFSRQGEPLALMRSRFWRIWPAYAVVFGLSSLLFWWGWGSAIYYAGNPPPAEWLRQMLLVAQPGGLRVVPIVWMLSAQLVAWGVLALCRGERRVIAWVLAVAALWVTSAGWHYQGLPVAIACTAAGALLPRRKLGPRLPGTALCYSVLLTHYPVGALLAESYGLAKGPLLFAAAIVPTVAAAYALYRF